MKFKDREKKIHSTAKNLRRRPSCQKTQAAAPQPAYSDGYAEPAIRHEGEFSPHSRDYFHQTSYLMGLLLGVVISIIIAVTGFICYFYFHHP